MLEPLRYRTAFQHKTNPEGPLTDVELLVEEEDGTTIVTQASLRPVVDMRTISQYSHSIITNYMPSPCARSTSKLDDIPAEAKCKALVRGPLAEVEWLVEMEAMPTLVTHACWRLVVGVCKVFQYSHITTFHSMPMTSPCTRNTRQ